ncbi:Hypothetical protein I596_3373 [Dokdonella koreensis DS-123]|uniref:Uncharacterized protein n=1 Tax=Dokdonella koreensis DS-123 TaxID=1300342 RepID=A0A167H7V0_9GAMM|nr:Hypothetical protein I596_3373 [Dokdonella koreensis DS-123]
MRCRRQPAISIENNVVFDGRFAYPVPKTSVRARDGAYRHALAAETSGFQ